MNIPDYMIVGCALCGNKMEPTTPYFLDDEKYIEAALRYKVESVMEDINKKDAIIHFDSIYVDYTDMDAYIYGDISPDADEDDDGPNLYRDDFCYERSILIAAFHCWKSFWAVDLTQKEGTFRRGVEDVRKNEPIVSQIVNCILSKVSSDIDNTLAYYRLLQLVREEARLPYTLLRETPSENKEWVEKYANEILENKELSEKIRQALSETN